MADENVKIQIAAEQTLLGVRQLRERIENLEHGLYEAKRAIVTISSIGHQNGYDWNKDEKNLTRLEGDLFQNINFLLSNKG